MSSALVPDWITPDGGFTALDLDHLPDLPPRTELIDGGLVFVSPHRKFHSRAIQLLLQAFHGAAPARPRLYARAGIKHFWRVEEVDGRPVVYVFELDPGTGAYSPSGIYHGTLKTDVPFPVEINLDTARDL